MAGGLLLREGQRVVRWLTHSSLPSLATQLLHMLGLCLVPVVITRAMTHGLWLPLPSPRLGLPSPTLLSSFHHFYPRRLRMWMPATIKSTFVRAALLLSATALMTSCSVAPHAILPSLGRRIPASPQKEAHCPELPPHAYYRKRRMT